MQMSLQEERTHACTPQSIWPSTRPQLSRSVVQGLANEARNAMDGKIAPALRPPKNNEYRKKSREGKRPESVITTSHKEQWQQKIDT